MILKVIYYYYFLFYIKILSEREPHTVTVFVLSVCEGLILNFFIRVSYTYATCNLYGVSGDIIITALILIVNFYYYLTLKNGIRIIREKPALFKSKKISLFIVVSFFLVCLNLIFSGGYVLQNIRSNC